MTPDDFQTSILHELCIILSPDIKKALTFVINLYIFFCNLCIYAIMHILLLLSLHRLNRVLKRVQKGNFGCFNILMMFGEL